MRTLVFRTFVGSCATLVMSVVNLSILTILDGEPGYICLCLCNLDSKQLSLQQHTIQLLTIKQSCSQS